MGHQLPRVRGPLRRSPDRNRQIRLVQARRPHHRAWETQHLLWMHWKPCEPHSHPVFAAIVRTDVLHSGEEELCRTEQKPRTGDGWAALEDYLPHASLLFSYIDAMLRI